MPARDINADVQQRVADAVQLLSFTETIGYVVYPVDGLVMVNGQQPQAQTHWRVTVTCRQACSAAPARWARERSSGRTRLSPLTGLLP
jgi:hypothetical protein